jgi:16S rRNA processing protein RimM
VASNGSFVPNRANFVKSRQNQRPKNTFISTPHQGHGAVNPSDIISLGLIAQAHGLRGELRVHLFNADSESLLRVRRVYLRHRGIQELHEYAIVNTRSHIKGILLTLEGIADRTSAEKLRGSEVCLKADELPKLPRDQCYLYQLEGLPVHNTHNGELLGRVIGVQPSSAQDLLVVSYQQREVLVPITPSIVTKIDIELGRIEVDPLPGLFDE